MNYGEIKFTYLFVNRVTGIARFCVMKSTVAELTL